MSKILDYFKILELGKKEEILSIGLPKFSNFACGAKSEEIWRLGLP